MFHNKPWGRALEREGQPPWPRHHGPSKTQRGCWAGGRGGKQPLLGIEFYLLEKEPEIRVISKVSGLFHSHLHSHSIPTVSFLFELSVLPHCSIPVGLARPSPPLADSQPGLPTTSSWLLPVWRCLRTVSFIHLEKHRISFRLRKIRIMRRIAYSSIPHNMPAAHALIWHRNQRKLKSRRRAASAHSSFCAVSWRTKPVSSDCTLQPSLICWRS